jgi:hypothetical protein
MSVDNPKIQEPMTMITDYIIGIQTMVMAMLLIVNFNADISRLLVAISFIATGIGAFLGGSSHGFKQFLTKKQDSIIWKFAIILIGIATVFLTLGIIVASISEFLLFYILTGLSILFFIIYTIWIMKHPKFIYVILYYVPSMLLIMIIKIVTLISLQDPSSIYFILGILLAFIGAGIQAKGISFHKHFNHNDLFHVVQMISFIFLYIGAVHFDDVGLIT